MNELSKILEACNVHTTDVFAVNEDVTSDEIDALFPVIVETVSVETIELVARRVETDKNPACNVLTLMVDATTADANMVDARKEEVTIDDAFIDNPVIVDALIVDTRMELA